MKFFRSYSGVVNIYDTQTVLSSRSPTPVKAIMNLTTPCTNALFNCSSEILAISSFYAEKAVKLVRFPLFVLSCTSFLLSCCVLWLYLSYTSYLMWNPLCNTVPYGWCRYYIPGTFLWGILWSYKNKTCILILILILLRYMFLQWLYFPTFLREK